MKRTKKTKVYELPKGPGTVDDIIKWLFAITNGHERYPHDTAKLDGFPISYKDINTLAERLKKAYLREQRKVRKDAREMMKDLYYKNKNVLRHLNEFLERHIKDTKVGEDGRNMRFAMIYSIELQHLIHWYGFLKEYEELDEKFPCKAHNVDKKEKKDA